MNVPLQRGITNKSTWIFGYGSLIHTPNFLYDRRVVGCIKGYRRVFWQGSTDHRGTPERPGRTVTLTADPSPAAETWGVAFRLAGTPDEQAAALSYLEWREKEYDVREHVDVFSDDGSLLVPSALVYIASPANRNYLGPADARAIAVQIASCRGPSGPNCDYLFKLADAMRGMGVPDPGLFALEQMVRQELAARAGRQGPLPQPAALAKGVAAHVGDGVTEGREQGTQRPSALVPAASSLVAQCASEAALRSAEEGEEEKEEEEEEKEEEKESDFAVFRRWHQMGIAQTATDAQGTAAADPHAAANATCTAADAAGVLGDPDSSARSAGAGGRSTHSSELCHDAAEGATEYCGLYTSSRSRAAFSLDAVCGSACAGSEPG